METIPLEIFKKFQSQCTKKIYLFNKEIKNKIKNIKTLKNKSILNLYLNKINSENYLNQCRKFIEEKYINSSEFPKLTEEFFSKVISESNFTNEYLLFYQSLIENYYEDSKFDFSYLINLIETKFMLDFTNKNMLLKNTINKLIFLPNDIENKEKENYLKSFKINNLKLISFLINNNILKPELKKTIYEILENDVEYLYHFIRLNNDVEEIDKLDLEKYDLRIKTLFNELRNKTPTKTENNKHLVNENKGKKFSTKLLIINMIEEYLFMEDFEELKYFVENNILKKNLQVKFVETVLLYGKNNKMEKEMKEILEKLKVILNKKPVKLNL